MKKDKQDVNALIQKTGYNRNQNNMIFKKKFDIRKMAYKLPGIKES